MDSAIRYSSSQLQNQPQPPQEQPETDVLSLEPDLILIVGGKQFEENSFLLRSCSEYFRQVLGEHNSNGMLVLEFPDKCPDQWTLVRQILQPFSTTPITLDNLKKVLPWLFFLKVSKGLDDCDQVLAEQLGGQKLEMDKGEEKEEKEQDWLGPLRKYLRMLLDGLETAANYNLPTSKEVFLTTLTPVLQNHPMLFGEPECRILGELLRIDQECRNTLWPVLLPYLPEYADLDPEQALVVVTKSGSSFDFAKELQKGMAQYHKWFHQKNPMERRALTWFQKKARNRQRTQAEKQKQKEKEKEKLRLRRKQLEDERLLQKSVVAQTRTTAKMDYETYLAV